MAYDEAAADRHSLVALPSRGACLHGIGSMH